MRVTFLHLLPSLTLLIASGCALLDSGQPPEAAVPSATTADVVLGPGDVVNIKVYREPDLAGVYRVGQAGDISFPLIGSVKLTGRNAYEVADEIRTRLGNGYLQQPQVMVFVQEYNSRKIHVLGQVAKAGSFGFKSGMSIIEAVAEAGGFTKLASTNRVRVTRVINGSEQKFTVPVGDIRTGNASNFQLEPGDIVYIPEAIF